MNTPLESIKQGSATVIQVATDLRISYEKARYQVNKLIKEGKVQKTESGILLLIPDEPPIMMTPPPIPPSFEPDPVKKKTVQKARTNTKIFALRQALNNGIRSRKTLMEMTGYDTNNLSVSISILRSKNLFVGELTN